MMNEGLMDGRRERGERTRHTVAARAAAVASIDGLAGMTLSKLADALNVSKSSIQAAFRTKEEVQLAAVGAATEIFVANVIAPARGHPEGLERLDALVECWLGYIERRVLPGGCFMGATLAEFPGAESKPVARDSPTTNIESANEQAIASASVGRTVGVRDRRHPRCRERRTEYAR
jgi:AcrR family transcriptional regulator